MAATSKQTRSHQESRRGTDNVRINNPYAANVLPADMSLYEETTCCSVLEPVTPLSCTIMQRDASHSFSTNSLSRNSSARSTPTKDLDVLPSSRPFASNIITTTTHRATATSHTATPHTASHSPLGSSVGSPTRITRIYHNGRPVPVPLMF